MAGAIALGGATAAFAANRANHNEPQLGVGRSVALSSRRPGIEGTVFWAVLMAFVSLLPAVGCALVWLPVALYFLVTGAIWQGITLIAYGVLVIGLVDNVLRPVLVGKDTKIPDYVVLISTLGGITVLGFNGLVIGPGIAAMFIAVWSRGAVSRAAGAGNRDNRQAE